MTNVDRSEQLDVRWCTLLCYYCYFFFFFFKQKTAYEISLGLVGSEMCIRDRTTRVSAGGVDR